MFLLSIKRGTIIVHPDHSVVLAKENALANPLVGDFVAGKDKVATNGRYIGQNNVELMTNGRALAEPRCFVVVVQSADEALAIVTLVRKRQTLYLVSILAVAVLLILYVLWQTNRPLRQLEIGAQLIGAGDFSHRITILSSNELGVVTESFNTMAEESCRRKDGVGAAGMVETRGRRTR